MAGFEVEIQFVAYWASVCSLLRYLQYFLWNIHFLLNLSNFHRNVWLWPFGVEIWGVFSVFLNLTMRLLLVSTPHIICGCRDWQVSETELVPGKLTCCGWILIIVESTKVLSMWYCETSKSDCFEKFRFFKFCFQWILLNVFCILWES